MPKAAYDRSRVYLTNKLIDEYVHDSCTTLTFATAMRATTLKMGKEAFEAELAKTPNGKRVNIKRQVAEHGLDAPVVLEAVRHHEKLLDWIEAGVARGGYIAGDRYSIADIAATPYVWRLEQLRLARMWDRRPGVAAWYRRMQERPSFDAAINRVVTEEDFQRYRSFEPDPWPKIGALLKTA
jgi:glutathione S-transferase